MVIAILKMASVGYPWDKVCCVGCYHI